MESATSSRELAGPAGLMRLTLAVALAGAAFFELATLAGWMAGGDRYGRALFIALYAFSLSLTLISAGALLRAWWLDRRPALLLGSVALFSWFLGSFFWVSYVFMLGRILVYPSVAEFAFQGFHIVMIVLLYGLLRDGDIPFSVPAAAIVPVLTLLPLALSLFMRIRLNNLLYSSFFMLLISLSAALTLSFAVRRRLPLLALGMALVIVADVSFVVVSLSRTSFVFALDPLWFTGFVLTAFALVQGAARGELP